MESLSEPLKFKWTFNSNFSIRSFKNLNTNIRVFKEKQIRPESLDVVSVDFVVQKCHSARYIIKELDILLKKGGIFEITIINSSDHSAYFLSKDQVKYEFSVSTNGRYVLSSEINNKGYLNLKYTKIISTLEESDSINKWSFGIITNGKKNEKVEELIRSIIQQNIPQYEIIICGPFNKNNFIDNDFMKVIDDVVLENDIRFPISAKKNKIIASAVFDNLAILHDRFLLPSTWFENMVNYGNYFDYLCLPTKDIFNNRFAVDWMTFVFPLTKTIVRNRSLSYDAWSSSIIIQGGVILGKKHLLRKHKLDERLFWQELEDIHFSKVAYLDGAFFYMDKHNYFISESVNHKPNSKETKLRSIVNTILWHINILKSYVKFYILTKKYYQ